MVDHDPEGYTMKRTPYHRIVVRVVTREMERNGDVSHCKRYSQLTIKHIASLSDARLLVEAINATSTQEIERECHVCVTVMSAFGFASVTLPIDHLQSMADDIRTIDAVLSLPALPRSC